MKKIFVCICLSLLFTTSIFGAKSAVIETSVGFMELTLRDDVAPKACENFVALAKKGYYNGVVFHRVIKGFMVQTGDPTGTGSGGESIWGKPFGDEITPKLTFDTPFVLAMANRGANTNGSQFFITTAPARWLNGHHTIFGTLKSGQDTLKKIESAPTGFGDRPKQTIKIIKVDIK